MHIDSALSSNVQLADWVAACVGRAVDYQLLEYSRYGWVSHWHSAAMKGAFTYESKLSLWHRAVPHLHHSQIFEGARPLYPEARGQQLRHSVDPQVLRRIKAAAERAHPGRR